ncbi:MAG TPA: hypothetical protein VM076_09570, partial [Gemmatimonadaceae bacterium]|nr:hypothetical protein [Gemmatimonadaceae bacterium]
MMATGRQRFRRFTGRRVVGATLVVLTAVAAACSDDDNPTGLGGGAQDRVSLGTVAIGTTAGDLPTPPAAPDAQMKAVLDQIAAANPRMLHTLSPQQARNQPTVADAVRAVLAAQGRPASAALEPVARVEHRTIPGVTNASGDSLLVRMYTPAGSGPFPVVTYY